MVHTFTNIIKAKHHLSLQLIALHMTLEFLAWEYARKWGDVNGQYNNKVNECSELTDYYVYVNLGS